MTANKAVVSRLADGVINQGNTQLVADRIASDAVGHFLDGDLYGPEGVETRQSSVAVTDSSSV